MGQFLHLNPGSKYASIKGHKSISRDQDVEVLLNKRKLNVHCGIREVFAKVKLNIVSLVRCATRRYAQFIQIECIMYNAKAELL